MENNIISSDNISVDLLKKIFDDAYLDVSIDEKGGDLCIQENWRTWIYIDEKKRYLSFNLHFFVNEKSKLSDRIEYTHNVSKEYILLKAFDDNGAITFKTYIWLEGGVTPKNIIKTYKAFIWVTEEALTLKGAEKVIQ